jgi:hypothetical protein
MANPTTTMLTATKSKTKGKCAQANALETFFHQTSPLQKTHFATFILTMLLPAAFKSLAEFLLDLFLKLRIELYRQSRKKSRLSKEDFHPIKGRASQYLK